MKRSCSLSPMPTKFKMSEKTYNFTEGCLKMDLPENMILLGELSFLVVRNFLGHTRVHVRRFILDENKKLQPTKDGVSLSPKVWSTFVEKLSGFWRIRPNTDAIAILQKDLCLSNVVTDGNIQLCLQRLFVKRDKSFQFVPERIILSSDQVKILRCSVDRVKELMESSLLMYTLRFHVEKGLNNYPSPTMEVNEDVTGFPEGFHDCIGSLSRCLKLLICAKIHELIDCYGCIHNSLTQNDHSCIGSLESRCDEYFDMALYSLNYIDLAQQFLTDNVHHAYFRNLILFHDFFLSLNVPELLKSVRYLYVNENPLDALFPFLLR